MIPCDPVAHAWLCLPLFDPPPCVSDCKHREPVDGYGYAEEGANEPSERVKAEDPRSWSEYEEGLSREGYWGY